MNGQMIHGRRLLLIAKLSRLQETIKKREVPVEVIQGVNEFREEMMALQLDEESRLNLN